MKKIKLLYVVDDDEIFRFLSRKIITDSGLVDSIQFYSNGRQALDQLKAAASNNGQLPEVIFLDLFMPIMDGWDFLEEFISLKPQLDKKIRIYVVSSSINLKDYDRAKAISDISDYIVKPIKKELGEHLKLTLLDRLSTPEVHAY